MAIKQQPVHRVNVKEAHKLCIELPLIFDRLMRAGLYQTAREFQAGPLKRIGWELAAHLGKPRRAK